LPLAAGPSKAPRVVQPPVESNMAGATKTNRAEQQAGGKRLPLPVHSRPVDAIPFSTTHRTIHCATLLYCAASPSPPSRLGKGETRGECSSFSPLFYPPHRIIRAPRTSRDRGTPFSRPDIAAASRQKAGGLPSVHQTPSDSHHVLRKAESVEDGYFEKVPLTARSPRCVSMWSTEVHKTVAKAGFGRLGVRSGVVVSSRWTSNKG
jgi:hypothetical protein